MSMYCRGTYMVTDMLATLRKDKGNSIFYCRCRKESMEMFWYLSCILQIHRTLIKTFSNCQGIRDLA